MTLLKKKEPRWFVGGLRCVPGGRFGPCLGHVWGIPLQARLWEGVKIKFLEELRGPSLKAVGCHRMS